MGRVVLNIIMISAVSFLPRVPDLYAGALHQTEGGSTGARAEMQAEKESGSAGLEIEDRLPSAGAPRSSVNLFFIDTIVPGGGHFYQKNYYTGAAFAFLKLSGAFFLYYFYNDLNDKRDEYRSIRGGPAAGADEIEEKKRDYERSHQHVTFAVIGNIAVFLSSYMISLGGLKKLNENSIPAFDLKYSFDKNFNYRRCEVMASVTLRV